MSNKQTDDILNNIYNKNAATPTPTSDEPDTKDVDPASKGFPAQIGKGIFAKHLEIARPFGVKSLAHLIGLKPADEKGHAMPINLGSRREAGQMPDDTRKALLELKKTYSNAEIQANVMFRTTNVSADMIKQTPIYKDYLQPLLKAYNVDDFSSWVPQTQARFYFEEYELPQILADQFDQLPMDSASMLVPGDLGLLEGREESDTATFSEQATTASEYLVTARNNVVHAKITEDLLADSAPAYLERYRMNVLKGVIRSYEKAIINGDTTQTTVRGDAHLDSDTRALAINQTFLKAFDGLRRRALNNTLNGTAINHADTVSKAFFENMLIAAGDMASEKDDLVYIVPQIIETKLVTGAIPELFTAFAFGGLASNVTGRCPPVFGINVVTTSHMRTDLNATGVYDGVTTNLTGGLLVKKSRFMNFMRQAVRIWAAPSLPSSDVMLMTAKVRQTFGGNPQSETEKAVIYTYNTSV